MPLSANQLRDNPWWRSRDTISEDPDLRRLAEQPAKYHHQIPFDLGLDAVYTLRGPRQVGKSTLLKRIIKHLLYEGGVPPRDVFYFDAEGTGIDSPAGLEEVTVAFLDWSRSSDPDSRKYILLDEVTGVPDWGTFVRVLYRRGALDGTTVIVTGSHALDIKRGGETAPGRRGEAHGVDLDWIMMPFGFRDFVFAHAPELRTTIPTIDVFRPREAAEVSMDMRLYEDAIRPLFDRYLLTGGYPHAMAAEQSTGRIPRSIYDLYRQAITGQMKRAGHREPYFREVVSWASDNHLGREFSWRAVSGETTIGSKDTARAYIEDAEAMFLWYIFYRAQSATDPAQALRSPKKLYPADPFTWHVLSSWIGRARDPWARSLQQLERGAMRGELVESIAADHFRRLYGAGALYHRASRGAEEIDFLLTEEQRLAYVEIKYRNVIQQQHTKWLAKYGGGVLATIDQWDWDDEANVASVPLHALLAGCPRRTSLFPAHS